MNNEIFYTAETLSHVTNKSKSVCYKIIQDLNKELEKKGYRTLHGRVPIDYFNKVYNITGIKQQKKGSK